jgi:pilus assembly protein CpaF
MATMYSDSLRAFLKPVNQYLDDESVTEILINGPADIWIERKGRLVKTDATFSEEGLLGAARNMAQFVGRPLNDERPRLDARLPDGSRIHVVLSPIARRGTAIAIRKFFKEPLGTQDLVRLGTMTPQMLRVVEAVIAVKLNTMVSGGSGSGKTTLLNVFSSLIADGERLITIEDSAELQLKHRHLVSLETRPNDKAGKGEISLAVLLQSALRLRPDRLIVGEVRGGEAFDLIQAMNTGHGGSLATVHANSPTDTLRRIEALSLMSAVELPMVAVRAQVASAVNFVVCCERLNDGARKIIALSEVLPLTEKGDYRTQDLWLFVPVTKDEDGRILGYHAPTGILPTFLAKARACGFPDLDEAYFDPTTYGVPPPPLIHGLGEQVTTRWAPSLKHRERHEADPERFRDEWRAFEERLKADAKAARGGPPGAKVDAGRPRTASSAAQAVAGVVPSPAAATRPSASTAPLTAPPNLRAPLLAKKPPPEAVSPPHPPVTGRSAASFQVAVDLGHSPGGTSEDDTSAGPSPTTRKQPAVAAAVAPAADEAWISADEEDPPEVEDSQATRIKSIPVAPPNRRPLQERPTPMPSTARALPIKPPKR